MIEELASITLPKKLVFALNSAVVGTPILWFIENFIFSDWSFAISLLLLVVMDTAVGGLAHVINRDFSGVKFWTKLAKKMFALTIVLSTIGVLKKVLISGEPSIFASFVDSAAYAVMIAFEASSILKNIYRIYPWEPIKELLKKLDIYYNEKTKKVDDETN